MRFQSLVSGLLAVSSLGDAAVSTAGSRKDVANGHAQKIAPQVFIISMVGALHSSNRAMTS